MTLFQLSERDDQIERFNTHNQWFEDTANMANNFTPKNFTDDINWMECKAKIISLIKSQPGRNGVPLDYVSRDNVAAIVQTNTDFIDDYVDRNPPTGRVFNADASKVHSYIVRLISENTVAEQKLLPFKDSYDGRVD